ncbi:MAG: nucleotidyl transferase AbiEii/AbiGii toxin family protein [Kiritimatiellae bacterium]|nr:nucleotidyl transferase AbiEii/AbiGii toxin family protein [Kiritimatiellia bacterium]
MALTEFQRTVCRLLAAHRIEQGESYVAGGVALNALIAAPRISRDIDLFHDTAEALDATWTADRRLLEQSRLEVEILRERPSFVEARVSGAGNSVRIQWSADSAYRFFPLVEHEEFGLTLHPFDLATNKVLALVGRLEVRDWIDVISCHEKLQPLGYLAWAACGKDPGFSPETILEQAARSAHYSADEVAELSFDGEPPDAGALSRKWHALLAEASDIVAALPPGEAGKCVLDRKGNLCSANAGQIEDALKQDAVTFHAGCIRGALPKIGDDA